MCANFFFSDITPPEGNRRNMPPEDFTLKQKLNEFLSCLQYVARKWDRHQSRAMKFKKNQKYLGKVNFQNIKSGKIT